MALYPWTKRGNRRGIAGSSRLQTAKRIGGRFPQNKGGAAFRVISTHRCANARDDGVA